MTKRVNWLLPIFVILVLSTTAFANESYIMDFERGMIQVSMDGAQGFSNCFPPMELDNVAFIPNSQQYVLFYLPFKDNDRGKIFTVDRDGHPTHTFELGYARFVKAESSDHRNILISYRVAKENSTYELAYYDGDKGELFKAPLNDLLNVYDIKFTPSANIAYVLGLDHEKHHVLLRVSFNPYALQTKLDLGNLPIHNDEAFNILHHTELELFNDDQAVVMNYGGLNPQDPAKAMPGRFLLIDLTQSRVTDEQKMPSEVFSQWFPKNKCLIIAGRDIIGNVDDMGWQGKGLFIKINATGVRSVVTSNWWNYQYQEDADCLYYLTNDQFGIYRFSDGVGDQWRAGENVCTQIVDNWVPSYPDALRVSQDGRYALCWNPKSGRTRFIDIVGKKVIAKRTGFGLRGKALEQNDGKTVIGANPDYTKFYLLKNEHTVQVFNEQFVQTSTIKLPDYVVGMYLTDSNQTLIITKRLIYRIEDDKLIPIYEFKQKISECYALQSGHESIILTDGELLGIDLKSFQVRPIAKVGVPLDGKTLVIYGHLKEKLMHLRS